MDWCVNITGLICVGFASLCKKFMISWNCIDITGFIRMVIIMWKIYGVMELYWHYKPWTWTKLGLSFLSWESVLCFGFFYLCVFAIRCDIQQKKISVIYIWNGPTRTWKYKVLGVWCDSGMYTTLFTEYFIQAIINPAATCHFMGILIYHHEVLPLWWQLVHMSISHKPGGGIML